MVPYTIISDNSDSHLGLTVSILIFEFLVDYVKGLPRSNPANNQHIFDLQLVRNPTHLAVAQINNKIKLAKNYHYEGIRYITSDQSNPCDIPFYVVVLSHRRLRSVFLPLFHSSLTPFSNIGLAFFVNSR